MPIFIRKVSFKEQIIHKHLSISLGPENLLKFRQQDYWVLNFPWIDPKGCDVSLFQNLTDSQKMIIVPMGGIIYNVSHLLNSAISYK